MKRTPLGNSLLAVIERWSSLRGFESQPQCPMSQFLLQMNLGALLTASLARTSFEKQWRIQLPWNLPFTQEPLMMMADQPGLLASCTILLIHCIFDLLQLSSRFSQFKHYAAV